MNWINRIGNILPTRTRDNPNQGRVYDIRGLAPTLCQGGGTPLIVVNFKASGSENNQQT